VFIVTHSTTRSMNTSTSLRDETRPLHDPLAAGDGLRCDTSLKFVRVIEERADGLVAFEFSIGWPELAVELLLPVQAFVEFCTTHRVRRLD
jgi:phenol hydroxylase P0 protein